MTGLASITESAIRVVMIDAPCGRGFSDPACQRGFGTRDKRFAAGAHRDSDQGPYFPRALLPKGRAVASIGPLPTGAVPAWTVYLASDDAVRRGCRQPDIAHQAQ